MVDFVVYPRFLAKHEKSCNRENQTEGNFNENNRDKQFFFKKKEEKKIENANPMYLISTA